MKSSVQLNLLIIDDNQLYAEQLIDVLESLYYQKVNLGFLDAKEELLKLLRQSWDVLIMGRAYDLSLPKVVQIIREQNLDIPVIAIIPDTPFGTIESTLTPKEKTQLDIVQEDDKTDTLLPLLTYWGAVAALPKDRVVEMAMRVHQEHEQLQLRSELSQLRHVLYDAEQRANILIKNSKSAVAYIEQGLHIYANEPYLQMFGFKSMEDLLGVPVVDLIASNNIQDFKRFLRDFEKGERDHVEFKFESVRTDGSTFAAKLQLASATYEGQPCLQVIIQPNMEANSEELAKKLAAAERIDPLTKLFNRRGFELLFMQLLNALTDKKITTLGLLFMRIDSIGKLHTKLGIQGVDTAVLTISEVLKGRVAFVLGEESVNQGYLSRFVENGFIIVLPNAYKEMMDQLAHSVIDDVNNLIIEVEKRTTKISVTVGGTIVNNGSIDTIVLIDRVGQAVNTAFKQNNNEGGGYYLYDPSAYASSDDDALLESLRNALTNNSFHLLYQPVYDVELDTSNLFEVFLRLPLADGTLMAPDKFLEVAIQNNLMEKIDRWVMIRACKDLKQYRNDVDPTARLLIHLSSRSLIDPTLPSFAAQLVKAVGGKNNDMLTLQFGEPVVNDHLKATADLSAQLKQIGVGLGIYNFGSAVNSVELLEFVKADLVRLDRSYIKDLGNSDNVDTISSVIDKINELGSSCLMAFIADPAAMSAAWTVGARYLQGMYLQAPSERMHIDV